MISGPTRTREQMKSDSEDVPILLFEHPEAWATWLAKNHATSSGLWLRLAKKASGMQSLSYSEALEAALCYGWIDAQKRSESSNTWLQKFTPRSKKSIWSRINREKALALIKAGQMKPAGLKAIQRAQEDGRWDAAYDSPSRATVPADLQAALDENARAKAFFATLNGSNRYAVLFRIQTAKKAETRARRIHQFIKMLERKEKLHP
jgi:uncharacterized protein YdeI (YjbR/CyaY-like superfamily)